MVSNKYHTENVSASLLASSRNLVHSFLSFVCLPFQYESCLCVQCYLRRLAQLLPAASINPGSVEGLELKALVLTRVSMMDVHLS